MKRFPPLILLIVAADLACILAGVPPLRSSLWMLGLFATGLLGLCGAAGVQSLWQWWKK